MQCGDAFLFASTNAEALKPEPQVSDVRDDCPFCQAAHGFAVTQVLHESADTVALFPLNPAVAGHTLVVPKTHVTDPAALTDAQAHALFGSVLRVQSAVRGGLEPDGINVIMSVGAAASQTVDHLHVHVVPRWHEDEFGDIWPRPSPPLGEDILSQAARAIRAALRDAT
jgi:histidine triad (HIT) family protein